MASRKEKIDSLRRYTNLIQKQTGRVVRPYRMDGYVNMLTKYGTSRDASERYEFKQEPPVPDEQLTSFYEGNGLFAKIIDAPAEEAIKHGFELEGLQDQNIEDFYTEALEELDWEETMMTAVKWARLFGGSIAVMMINDGRGVDEPLDWKNITSIDDIRIYDRSLIQPDYGSMFSYDPDDPFGTRGSRLGMPEYYDVYSRYGSFRVHDSRCLVFQNGILPENTSNSVYQLWGMPEYIRLNRAIRDAEVAHGTAPKMLDRSIQAVYRMKDLATELATEEGEDRVLRRLQTIDMARGLLNSITIDSEGEDYDFRQFSFTGVSEVIDTTCNFLSALTSIPQTILFGRSPAGMNSTGMGDLENWYNYLERIQNRMIKKNLRYLLSIIFQAGVCTGEIDEVPPIKVKFNPLWSLSDQEEASLEQMRAQVANTNANTAMVYVQMQALDPSEVRKKLADSEEFDVETLLDEYTEEELEENDPMKKQAEGAMPGMEGGGMPGMPGMPAMPGGPEGAPPEGAPPQAPDAMGGTPTGKVQPNDGPKPEMAQGGKEKDTDIGGNAPAAAPAATKLPVDMSGKEKDKAEEAKEELKKPVDKAKDNTQESTAKPEEKAEDAEDTLRNAWLGVGPEEEKPSDKKIIKKPKKPVDPLPGDTLRNAWLGITPKEEEDEEDTLTKAWHGTEPVDTEDTLRNAWLGNIPVKPPHGSRIVRTRKGDISIRDFRAASREDEENPLTAMYDHEITARNGKTYRAFEGEGYKAYGERMRESSRMDAGAQGAVGVYVIKDGKILTGIRGEGDGQYLLCGPGGHIEEGETPGQAAIRETQEEFGITPMELIPFGKGEKQSNGLRPDLFLCVRFEGKPKCDEHEMHNPRFTAIEEIEHSGRLFRPFENGIQKLIQAVTGKNIHADDEKWITVNGTHVLVDDDGTAKNGGKLKGMSFSKAESEESAKQTNAPGSNKILFQPSKTKINREISDIADKSTQDTVEDDIKKIGKLLDTLEPGSVVTVPANLAGDDKYTYTKDEDGRWGGKGTNGTWKAEDIAWDFLYEDPRERAYISKSALSETEKEKDRQSYEARNFRNQESPWAGDNSLAQMAEVQLQREDLKKAGEGTVAVDKDGRQLQCHGDGVWTDRDGNIVKNPSGLKVEGDYFDINCGLNGMDPIEISKVRDVFDKMPPDIQGIYEKTFREHGVRPSEEGWDISYFKPSDGRVYLREGSSAGTFFHEMSHALDRGAVDIEYVKENGEKYRVTSAAENLDWLAHPLKEKGREDFETMAKIVGFNTNGKGWFANEKEEQASVRQFIDWAYKYSDIPGFECVSDAVSAMTYDVCGASIYSGGHDRQYWTGSYLQGRKTSATSDEYWANFCELKAMRYDTALKLLKVITPNRYAAAEATYKEAFKKR